MFSSGSGNIPSRPGLSRSHAKRRALLEALESRVLLSGTVTVAVVGSSLLITGDAQNNDIVITGSNGAFAVNSGTNTTTITGGAINTSISKVIIKMNDGADKVTFNAATFGSYFPHALCSVSIDGGAGDNTVLLTGASIWGALTVVNGAGFDTLTTSGNTLVCGAISINNGAGGSQSSFQSGFVAGSNVSITNTAQTTNSITTFASVSIAGNLSVTNGNGLASTTLSDTRVGGKTIVVNGIGSSEQVNVVGSTLVKGLSVTTAAGGSNTQLISSMIGGDVNLNAAGTVGAAAVVTITGTTFNGNVTCALGSTKAGNTFDSTTVTASGSSVAKSFSLTAAAETNSLTIQMVGLAGNGKVAYATGYNTVMISNVMTGGDITFTSAGTGSDNLSMTGAIGGGLSVTSGNTSANASVPGDTLFVGGLTVGENLNVKTGAGADAITAVALSVQGTTSIQTGDGNDLLNIDDSDFGGNVSVVAGNGNGHINIETPSGGAAPTVFHANVSLKVGNGNNNVTAGQNGVSARRVVFLGSLSLVGGSGTDDFAYSSANLALMQLPSLKNFHLI